MNIGRHCRIRRAIIDKHVEIPAAHDDRLRPRGGPQALPRHRERDRGHPEGDADRAVRAAEPGAVSRPRRRSALLKAIGRSTGFSSTSSAPSSRSRSRRFCSPPSAVTTSTGIARGARVRLELPQDVAPVELRHRDVEQHDVRQLRAAAATSVSAPSCASSDLVPAALRVGGVEVARPPRRPRRRGCAAARLRVATCRPSIRLAGRSRELPPRVLPRSRVVTQGRPVRPSRRIAPGGAPCARRVTRERPRAYKADAMTPRIARARPAVRPRPAHRPARRPGRRPAAAPPRAAAAATPEIPFQLFKLENGLTVIVHEDRTNPIVGVHVQYDVGAKDEKPGRTGFAHLFEHLMFQGSEHLPKGLADRLVEAAGGDTNGSTSQDTTQYWEQVPSNALEQMLYVESDRMGFLLPTLTQDKLDNQREVVRNERRQSYEMRPYGLAFEKILANLWNPEFPYHWMPIGSHEDLQAASLEDVREFFRRFYGPENAVLAIAGDVDAGEGARARREVVRPDPGQAAARPPEAASRSRSARRSGVTMEDRVQLPAAVRRLADAEGLRARRRRARSRLAGPLRRQERPAREAARHGRADRAGRLGRPDEPGARLDVPRRRDPEAGRHARAAREGDRRGARPARRGAAVARRSSSARRTESRPARSSASSRWAASAAAPPRSPATTCAPGIPGYLGEDLARYRNATGADVSAAVRTLPAQGRPRRPVRRPAARRTPAAAPAAAKGESR